MKLLSDMCSGNGESMAGAIDTDTKFDEFGIPYIPSKRMKGCLREAAVELIDASGDLRYESLINQVFGEAGKENISDMIIENGYVHKYEMLHENISDARKDDRYKEYMINQYIQNYYTDIKRQTSIDKEHGNAEQNSLRTVRTLKKGLCFYFKVKFDDKYFDFISKCCKVLRHTGLSRTRGLGEIKCQLLKEDNNDLCEIKKNDTHIDDVNGKVVLEYNLTLQSQVMISGKDGNNNRTERYIPGSSILGYFAGRYVKKYSLGQEAHNNEQFKRLFLNNSTIYDNAYICDDNHEYEPCPVSIVRKKDENYFYNLAFKEDDADLSLKGINDEFIASDCDNRNYFKTPGIEMEYHHKRPQDRSFGHALINDHENEFYQYEVLKNNQTFKGRILGQKRDILELINLIPDDKLISIGKSKSAQYASAKINFKIEENDSEHLYVSKNQTFMLVLQSPMILLNEYGYYNADIKPLLNKITLQIKGIKYVKGYLRYKKVMGYNMKWKLPKQQQLALDMGSTIVLKYTGEEEADISFLQNERYGLKINEGYGKVKIFVKRDSNYEIKLSEENDMPFILKNQQCCDEFKNILVCIVKNNFIEELKYAALNKALNNLKGIRIANSTIGKLYNFLYDSEDIKEFIEKISSIKDISKREKCFKLFVHNKISDVDLKNTDKIEELMVKNIIENVINQTDFYTEKHYEYFPGIFDNKTIENNIFEYYKFYYLTLLNQIKYNSRIEKL